MNCKTDKSAEWNLYFCTTTPLKSLRHKWKNFLGKVKPVYKVLKTFWRRLEVPRSQIPQWSRILLYEPPLAPLKLGELFSADFCSDNRAGSTRSDRSCIFIKLWMTLVVTADSRHLLDAEHCCQLFLKSSVVPLALMFSPWCSLFITHFGSPEFYFTIVLLALWLVTASE